VGGGLSQVSCLHHDHDEVTLDRRTKQFVVGTVGECTQKQLGRWLRAFLSKSDLRQPVQGASTHGLTGRIQESFQDGARSGRLTGSEKIVDRSNRPTPRPLSIFR